MCGELKFLVRNSVKSLKTSQNFKILFKLSSFTIVFFQATLKQELRTAEEKNKYEKLN